MWVPLHNCNWMRCNCMAIFVKLQFAKEYYTIQWNAMRMIVLSHIRHTASACLYPSFDPFKIDESDKRPAPMADTTSDKWWKIVLSSMEHDDSFHAKRLQFRIKRFSPNKLVNSSCFAHQSHKNHHPLTQPLLDSSSLSIAGTVCAVCTQLSQLVLPFDRWTLH